MKKQIFHILALSALLAGAVSCDNAEYKPLKNQAFFSQTNTNAYSSQKITLGNDEAASSISIRLSEPATEDVSFRVKYDPAVLEAFNQRTSNTLDLYPEDLFTLTPSEVTILEGSSTSQPLEILVSPMTDEMKNSGKKYALAFSLESTDGKAGVLSSGAGFVYTLDRVVIQPVPVINYGTRVTGYFGDEMGGLEFREWTVEMDINMDLLGERIGQYNNQAITSIGLQSGPDGGNEIYIRFGDAPIEGNRLQCKTQGTQMNSNMQFAMNTWYHLAIVCSGSKLMFYVNGDLDNSMDLPGKAYKLVDSGVAGMSIAGTDYFKANAMVSEWRFWSVARTQDEIRNNMYSCDPSTSGLIGYFKLDEGEGNDFKDATGKGGHAACLTEPRWIQDVRIDGK